MNNTSTITTYRDLLQPPLKKEIKPTFCTRITEVVSIIALGIFYIISAWFSPFLFTLGFFVGTFYSDEVQQRMTKVFKNMSWKWIIPTAALLYGLSWPAAITVQGFLAGLDLGARFSKAAQGIYGK
jgi:hypothetical protein